MATLEDVFSLFEDNVNDKYYNCKLNTNNHSFNKCELPCNICICNDNNITIPKNIGRNDVTCSINKKCYINPLNDKCPICFDLINKKNNAFLTDCGHTYHKSCLSQYLTINRLHNPSKHLDCPICRCKLGLPDFDEYIYNINHKNCNFIDIIENFWMTNNIEGHICSNINIKGHYLGTNNNCLIFLLYKNKGFI